jgi:hypothetical protein
MHRREKERRRRGWAVWVVWVGGRGSDCSAAMILHRDKGWVDGEMDR